MKTVIITTLICFLSFSVKGQDCNFEADIKELCDLGGTYLKDFQIKPSDNKTVHNFTLVLSKNTKYLISCKANEKVNITLNKDNLPNHPPKNKNTKEPFLSELTSLAEYNTDNTGKPVFFEYIPEETDAYHLMVFSENENICAVAMISFLETVKTNEVVDTSKVYELVDENASFENGDLNNFRNYVLRNFNINPKEYPNFKGNIYIEFTVGRNGLIKKKPQIIKSCGKWDLDLQAIMIVEDSPKWKPAKVKGVNVKQKFIIPIPINL